MLKYSVGDVVKVDHVPAGEVEDMKIHGKSLFFPFNVEEFVGKTGTVVAVDSLGNGAKVRFTVNLEVFFTFDELDDGDAPKAWSHL